MEKDSMNKAIVLIQKLKLETSESFVTKSEIFKLTQKMDENATKYAETAASEIATQLH